jgi:hypothetical protein
MTAAVRSSLGDIGLMRRPHGVIVTGFVLVLVIRLALLPYKGTFDMVDYGDWGNRVRAHGLVQSLVLYPLVNQLFAAEVWLASELHVTVCAGLKLGTLLFDAASFFLLLSILPRLGADRRWALVYWLHPYFLGLFWLGCIDGHVGHLHPSSESCWSRSARMSSSPSRRASRWASRSCRNRRPSPSSRP